VQAVEEDLRQAPVRERRTERQLLGRELVGVEHHQPGCEQHRQHGGAQEHHGAECEQLGDVGAAAVAMGRRLDDLRDDHGGENAGLDDREDVVGQLVRDRERVGGTAEAADRRDEHDGAHQPGDAGDEGAGAEDGTGSAETGHSSPWDGVARASASAATPAAPAARRRRRTVRMTPRMNSRAIAVPRMPIPIPSQSARSVTSAAVAWPIGTPVELVSRKSTCTSPLATRASMGTSTRATLAPITSTSVVGAMSSRGSDGSLCSMTWTVHGRSLRTHTGSGAAEVISWTGLGCWMLTERSVVCTLSAR